MPKGPAVQARPLRSLPNQQAVWSNKRNINIIREMLTQPAQANSHMVAASIHTLGKDTTVTTQKAHQNERQDGVSKGITRGLLGNTPAHHPAGIIIITTIIGIVVQVMRKITSITITVDVIAVLYSTAMTTTKLVITRTSTIIMMIDTTAIRIITMTIVHQSTVTVERTINLIAVTKETLIEVILKSTQLHPITTDMVMSPVITT